MSLLIDHINVWVGEGFYSENVSVQLSKGVKCSCDAFVHRQTGLWCKHIAAVVEMMGGYVMYNRAERSTIKELANKLIPSVEPIPPPSFQ